MCVCFCEKMWTYYYTKHVVCTAVVYSSGTHRTRLGGNVYNSIAVFVYDDDEEEGPTRKTKNKYTKKKKTYKNIVCVAYIYMHIIIIIYYDI